MSRRPTIVMLMTRRLLIVMEIMRVVMKMEFFYCSTIPVSGSWTLHPRKHHDSLSISWISSESSHHSGYGVPNACILILMCFLFVFVHIFYCICVCICICVCSYFLLYLHLYFEELDQWKQISLRLQLATFSDKYLLNMLMSNNKLEMKGLLSS